MFTIIMHLKSIGYHARSKENEHYFAIELSWWKGGIT